VLPPDQLQTAQCLRQWTFLIVSATPGPTSYSPVLTTVNLSHSSLLFLHMCDRNEECLEFAGTWGVTNDCYVIGFGWESLKFVAPGEDEEGLTYHITTTKDMFCLPKEVISVSFITQTVLRQVRSLFQSEFSTGCDLVLPLSTSSILYFPEGYPVAAYAFFLVFPSFLSFLLTF
jgi:hypothetical protein